MKSTALIVFLLLGLAFTYAVPVEDEIAEDEPSAEDELIEDDEEEEIEDDEEEDDEEKRAVRPYPPRRRCRWCHRRIIRVKWFKIYVTKRCWCVRPCKYNRCARKHIKCRTLKSRYAYPKCW